MLKVYSAAAADRCRGLIKQALHDSCIRLHSSALRGKASWQLEAELTLFRIMVAPCSLQSPELPPRAAQIQMPAVLLSMSGSCRPLTNSTAGKADIEPQLGDNAGQSVQTWLPSSSLLSCIHLEH